MGVSGQYLFGDSDLAARRLQVVAEAFAPSSRAFVANAVDHKLSLAVDAGCGPGHTTHLLAETLRCSQVVGLDHSPHFIQLARQTATAAVSFQQHDVTMIPFPVGPCDLIYCRYLMTHQTDPGAILADWGTQLTRDGRILVEELDALQTHHPVFAEYVRIVEAMLADQGSNLYAGANLAGLPMPETLAVVSSDVARVPLKDDLAARMFCMNIETWQHVPFVKKNCPATSIRQLKQNLTGLAARPTDRSSIEWRLRQMVFRRA
jgi:SAM-dependent methyltransferase